MHQRPKYVYKTSEGLVLSDSRPGGAQWDHVTSYALFKETLRGLETSDPMGTIDRLVLLITNLNNNYAQFLSAQKDPDHSFQTPMDYKSARIAWRDAKEALLAAQTGQEAALIAVSDATEAAKSRNRADKNALAVAKDKLSNAIAEVKKTTKAFKTAAEKVPKTSEIDESVDEIVKQIELLKSAISPDDEIQRAVDAQPTEAGKQRIYDTIERGNQSAFDGVITKLANAYLILRNKQNFSSFPRYKGSEPPSDESSKVTNALATLKLFEADIIAGKRLSEAKVNTAVSAMKDLFWYPYISQTDLVGSDPVKLKAFRKVYPGKAEPRINDIEILKYVVSEHLQTVFSCYPHIDLAKQTKMSSLFIQQVAHEWGVVSKTKKGFEEAITAIYPQGYEELSLSSGVSTDNSEEESSSVEEGDGSQVAISANDETPPVNLGASVVHSYVASDRQESGISLEDAESIDVSQRDYEGGDELDDEDVESRNSPETAVQRGRDLNLETEDDDSELDADFDPADKTKEDPTWSSQFYNSFKSFWGIMTPAIPPKIVLHPNDKVPVSSLQIREDSARATSSKPSANAGDKRKRSEFEEDGVSGHEEPPSL